MTAAELKEIKMFCEELRGNEMNRQEIVLWGSTAEKAQLETFLKARGYRDPTEGRPEMPNAVHAYCVDSKKKVYFSVNATVCAARSQAGMKAITFSRLQECI